MPLCKRIRFPGLCAFNRRRGAYKLRVFSTGFNPPSMPPRACCAVYGFPIRHSASPAMHNAAFAALGLNWRYLAFEVRPDDLRSAIDRRQRAMPILAREPHRSATSCLAMANRG